MYSQFNRGMTLNSYGGYGAMNSGLFNTNNYGNYNQINNNLNQQN